MRSLVIGGTVFIGRAIVEKLLAGGHEVTILHRRGSHDLDPRVLNAQADRADLHAVARILREGAFDVVFDVAYDWQKGTTAAEVEAAARACGDQLQRYVFISSVAAYGPGVDHREDTSLVADDCPDPYSRHKAMSERALFRMHADSGFPVTTFRPPFVHGPRQPFYREQFFWDRLLDHRPIVLPDDGSTPMQWVFVSDLAEACVRAIGVPSAAGSAFNVGHLEPLTQRSFVETLARVAVAAPTFRSIPRSAINTGGGQLIGPNLYFGEFLDLPPHIIVIEKSRPSARLHTHAARDGACGRIRVVPVAASPSRRLQLRGSAAGGHVLICAWRGGL